MSDQPFDRRTVIRTAGVVGAGAVGAGLLAACGSSGTPATDAGPAAASSTSGSSSGANSSAAAGPSVKVADIPVGGGVTLPDLSPPLVVTQPTSGQFAAFDGTCTHQGCPVTRVSDGHILCPCHRSMFDIATGAPTADSQAKRPLAGKTATVSGDSVVIS